MSLFSTASLDLDPRTQRWPRTRGVSRVRACASPTSPKRHSARNKERANIKAPNLPPRGDNRRAICEKPPETMGAPQPHFDPNAHELIQLHAEFVRPSFDDVGRHERGEFIDADAVHISERRAPAIRKRPNQRLQRVHGVERNECKSARCLCRQIITQRGSHDAWCCWIPGRPHGGHQAHFPQTRR